MCSHSQILIFSSYHISESWHANYSYKSLIPMEETMVFPECQFLPKHFYHNILCKKILNVSIFPHVSELYFSGWLSKTLIIWLNSIHSSLFTLFSVIWSLPVPHTQLVVVVVLKLVRLLLFQTQLVTDFQEPFPDSSLILFALLTSMYNLHHIVSYIFIFILFSVISHLFIMSLKLRVGSWFLLFSFVLLSFQVSSMT